MYKKIPVVGGRYRAGVDWNNLKVGDTLTLIPEPENDDNTAVAVYAHEMHIGYVPREWGAKLSPLILGNYVQVRARLCSELSDLVDLRRFQQLEMECYIEKINQPVSPG